MFHCPNCGKELDQTYNFCIYCGTELQKNKPKNKQPVNIEVKGQKAQILSALEKEALTTQEIIERTKIPQWIVWDALEEFVANGLVYMSGNYYIHRCGENAQVSAQILNLLDTKILTAKEIAKKTGFQEQQVHTELGNLITIGLIYEKKDALIGSCYVSYSFKKKYEQKNRQPTTHNPQIVAGLITGLVMLGIGFSIQLPVLYSVGITLTVVCIALLVRQRRRKHIRTTESST